MSSLDSNSKSPTNPRQSAILAGVGAGALFLLLLVVHECSGGADAAAAEKVKREARPDIVTVAPAVPKVEVRVLADPGFAVGVNGRTLTGRILDDQGEPIRSQPYWVHWGHQDLDAKQDLEDVTRPPPRCRRTDSLGRFSVELREPGRGLLWFHAPAGLRAACRISPDTLKSREWNNIRLPKTDTVAIKGIDLPPAARFRVVVNPATKSKSGWDSSEIERWPAHFWHRSDTQVDILLTHTFTSPEFIGSGHMRTLAWRPFELDVQGEDFEVLPDEDRDRIVRAPGERVFRVGKKTPSGIVVVRESAGGPPTEMPGVLITGPIEGAGRWRERSELRGGRCSLGYQMLRANEATRLWVIMADGESFATRLAVAAAGPQPTVTLVRGQGTPPAIIPLRIDRMSGSTVILGAIDTGQIVRGQPWSELGIADDDRRFGYVLRDDAVRLVRCPPDLTGLFVLNEDGRVATGRQSAAWLPGSVANDVSLEHAYRRFGKQGDARAEFDLEIETKGGRRIWITLDRCTMGPRTTWFPVWRKFVPTGMRARFAFAAEGEEPVELIPGQ